MASRAGTIQRGLGEGPRQVQSLYARIQNQYLASRHAASLRVCLATCAMSLNMKPEIAHSCLAMMITAGTTATPLRRSTFLHTGAEIYQIGRQKKTLSGGHSVAKEIL